MPLVNSTNLSRVEYDGDTEVLTVWFNYDGAVYNYEGVPEALYNALLRSPSVGSFFANNIRTNYPYTRIA